MCHCWIHLQFITGQIYYVYCSTQVLACHYISMYFFSVRLSLNGVHHLIVNKPKIFCSFPLLWNLQVLCNYYNMFFVFLSGYYEQSWVYKEFCPFQSSAALFIPLNIPRYPPRYLINKILQLHTLFQCNRVKTKTVDVSHPLHPVSCSSRCCKIQGILY